ncbi:cytochrome c oxidase subunit CcoM [Saccharospirillum alexandrii]|nr:cytochrome c oxidase subunit CcoM [Saccharospirillum alexandrii]
MYMDTVVFASLLTVGLIVGFMGIWGYVVYQGLHNDHNSDE